MSRLVSDEELARRKAQGEAKYGRPLSAYEAFAEAECGNAADKERKEAAGGDEEENEEEENEEEENEEENEGVMTAPTKKKTKELEQKTSTQQPELIAGEDVPVSLQDEAAWKKFVVEQLERIPGWQGKGTNREYKRWDEAARLFNEALGPRGSRLRKSSSAALRAWAGDSVPHVKKVSLAESRTSPKKKSKQTKKRSANNKGKAERSNNTRKRRRRNK
jgi:hypothetical protein